MEPPAAFGRDRDYCIDLVPKFMMAAGELVNVLVHTDVTKYLEFNQIAGSYVLRDRYIAKVPSTPMEALSSSLMGIFEKRRARSFFEFIQNVDFNNSSTWQGLDINTVPMSQVYKKFGLELGTQDFIGHSLALHLDDSYVDLPAKDTISRIKLYTNSMARYGKSPYIYPLYGLGELPQGFARLSAIYGGTYMLDKSIDSIVYDENGKVCGVKSGDEIAKCSAVIGDPSYFPDKVKSVHKIIRVICLLNHPIPNTADSDSVQIILPQRQVKRKNDIYIACVSSAHNVCAKGMYVAIVSTILEQDNLAADPMSEVQPALSLLGPIAESFTSICDMYEPLEDGKKDNVFISKSYDATSHFETVNHDVTDLYQRITGKALVLKKREENGNGNGNENSGEH